MRKAKTWKQRIFVSLVAVCMAITLVPATAMAAGETETPGQLVDKVTLAKAETGDPALGDDYKTNIDAITNVNYQPASGKIIVTANRNLMKKYVGGDGENRMHYALVMNFNVEDLSQVSASGGYVIEHGNGDSAGDVREKFVPDDVKQGYAHPIVFWLDAAADQRTFTLKDDGSKKTQQITVEINDVSKFVREVTSCKESIDSLSSTERVLYHRNMGAVYDVDWNSADNTITVIADRFQMKAYDRDRKTGTQQDGEQLYYAVAMLFNEDSIHSGHEITAEGYNIEACDKESGSKTYVPDEVSEDAIVFWLDAAKDTSSFTLCKQIVEAPESEEAERATFRATQKITVKVKEPIILNQTTANIKQGKTVTLNAATGDGSSAIWESEDEEIAIVGQSGIVVGMAPGTTNITAKTEIGGKEAVGACEVTVTEDDTANAQNAAIALNKKAVTLYTKMKNKDTVLLEALVLGKSKNVTWKSSNPKVAAVSEGKVTAKKAGKATITATANGVSAKCVVTVKKPTLKLSKAGSAVKLPKADATIKRGETVKIKVKVTPKGKITYKSNKKKVATVNAKGVVKGKKKGTAKITVTANGVKKIFTVRVK